MKLKLYLGMRLVLIPFYLLYKIYVMIVFVVTLVALYPFFFIVLSFPKLRVFSFQLNIFWCYLFRTLAFVFLKFTKKAKIPKGPYIICSNHASYFDIFIMYSVIPNHKFLFLGKSEILNYPLMRTYFKKLNIPVYRSDRIKAAKSFVQAKREVEKGWSLMIFPEGTIPDENLPHMIPFKDGAFQLAKHCNVPIIPITFQNNHKLFTEPSQWKESARPGIAYVQIHEYISVETISELTVKELSQKVFDCIASGLPK
jgi:1-acyl-sn-glycerol-3-phosphate acyltransferase